MTKQLLKKRQLLYDKALQEVKIKFKHPSSSQIFMSMILNLCDEIELLKEKQK